MRFWKHGYRASAFLGLALVSILLCAGALGPWLRPAFAALSGKDDPAVDVDRTVAWKEIDRLVAEQKLEEASAATAKVLAAARAAGDSDDWARALIQETQLRMALHGYATAVRFLREEPWPPDPLYRAALNLFYAHSLATYYNSYRWEVDQREHVEHPAGTVPQLETWTRDEIFAAAINAYLEVWNDRERLSKIPVSRLAQYLEPNDYPEGIRGTLRDAVSYLFAELLANTGDWSPQELSEGPGLDLRRLLADGMKADLADANVHPLEKLTAVLADLEAWHLREGNRAAALEARLERVRRLRSMASTEEDQLLLRRDLEERLPAFRDTSWWSMGMAELAELVRDEASPDHLVRAWKIALEGAEAAPGTPGAVRCRDLVEAIEAPTYHVEGMLSDGLDRRSLRVTHKNLPNLHFRAFRIDPVRRFEKERSQNLFELRDLESFLRGHRPDAAWTTELPPTPDYEAHITYVVPPIRRPGAYFIVASAREDFAAEDNLRLVSGLFLGDLVLVAHGGRQKDFEVTALSGATGRPIPGAEVRLYERNWQTGPVLRETRTTGADGRVLLSHRSPQNQFVLGLRGEDAALVERYPTYENPESSEGAALIYTDRAIYRPQQKLYWKVLAYRGLRSEGKLSAATRRTLKVSLVDPNGQEVASRSVTTNEFGTAAGDFVIPPGRPLGAWALRTRDGWAQIRVEEYKRPTFEVALDDPPAPPRLGSPSAFTGHARYYFGLPVVSGKVRWRATREPVYPWWFWWSSPGRGRGENIVASGTAELAEDGSFRIEFTPQPETKGDSPDVTYRYRLTAEVIDEGGETRDASRVFRLGQVNVEAAVDRPSDFFLAGKPAAVSIVRRDLDGVPRPGEGAWTLVEVRQPDKAPLPADLPRTEPVPEGSYRTPGDTLRPREEASSYAPREVLRLWPDGRKISGGALRHGADGKAEVSLPDLAPGVYRLRYETRDDQGARYETSQELIVAGGKTPLALPAVLEVDRSEARVGGTIRLLAGSALPDQISFLEIYRAGELIDRRELAGDRALGLIEIPVREADRGGLGFRLVTLRDHQLLTPATRVFVPWDDRELEVQLSTFRDRIRPGARETWTVTVRSRKGSGAEAAAAEVLAAMVDRSLDLFGPYTPPDPLSLFPDRTALDMLQSNLGQLSIVSADQKGWGPIPQWRGLRGDRLRDIEGYGIGGPGVRGRMAKLQSLGYATKPQPAPAPPVAKQEGFAEAMTVTAEAPLLDERRISMAATGSATEAPAPRLRADFAETAFWQPQLRTGRDGSAAIEFTVPDSVTSWWVWVHALTRDFRSGSVRRQAESVQELMVRPYVPRFLREGDRAELAVVVNNASDAPMRGEVEIDIVDPRTDESLLGEFGLARGDVRRAFNAKATGSDRVTFAITTPRRVGEVAFKVTASAGDLSDGELRPVPVLPSRLHLAQSRFATLHGKERRELTFADLARDDDPTRIDEQMVVTLDAQLFYSVLQALPYLIDYPYECTEQTLNRFLSTGIVSSLFKRYPAVAKMAAEMAKRDTLFETWDTADPNRKMALEETPWLQMARGGLTDGEDPGLIRVLDPRIARAERDAALAKLVKAQLPSGAFPWWPGGPPSDYMTLYILYGFAKAAEMGVELPREPVVKGWSYIAQRYRSEYAPAIGKEEGCCVETLTFLNYVASAYPDPSWMGDALTAEERKRILDYSFRHWKRHSPYLKGMLALTLRRMGRPDDARLVFDSVLDSAKTTPDEGTFWMPEERSWLWYNDTIETHAFALRTLAELRPDDPRRHGLVQWLFLNKKLNHWKSTRATAEVLYALVHYLEKEGQLGVREAATVRVAGQTTTFAFEPDRYTGKKNQIVIPGEKIDPKTASTVVVEKDTPGLMFASATWHFSTDELPREESGDLFHVSRRYFRRVQKQKEMILEPLATGDVLHPGDEVEIHLSIRSKALAEYVHLRDPRAAGLEPGAVVSGYRWNLGIAWYEETRDSGTNFFFEDLPAGEYTLKYRLRANMAGTFRTGPATLQSMYAPEFTAYSTGTVIRVGEGAPASLPAE
jgi:alpha-2-macroglobulin